MFKRKVIYDFTEMKILSQMICNYIKEYSKKLMKNGTTVIEEGNYKIVIQVAKDGAFGFIRIDAFYKNKKIIYILYDLVRLSYDQDSNFKINNKCYKFIENRSNEVNFKDDYGVIAELIYYVTNLVFLLIDDIKTETFLYERKIKRGEKCE